MSTGPTSADDTALLLESPRRLSVEDYHRMIEAGILDEDERVELLEGVVVAMAPQGPPHAYCIQWLNRHLGRALGDEYFVRPQLPLTLGQWNEPEPDLVVVPANLAFNERHPGTALLAIEIADASLRRDRRVKSTVYARFGVLEYWIVNIEARAIEVSWDPDAEAGRYRSARTFGVSEIVVSRALPQLSVPVADLFA